MRQALVVVAVLGLSATAWAAPVPAKAPAMQHAAPEEPQSLTPSLWSAAPLALAGLAGAGVVGVAVLSTVLAARPGMTGLPAVEVARPNLSRPNVVLDPRLWTVQTTAVVLLVGLGAAAVTVGALALASKMSCLMFKAMCVGALAGAGFTVFLVHGRELAPCLWEALDMDTLLQH